MSADSAAPHNGRAGDDAAIDLTGRKFTRLLVLTRAGSNTRGRAMWNARCDCGTELEVMGKVLLSGNTRSCGCLQRDRASQTRLIDLVGQRFGRLVVLERNGSLNRKVRWICRCDCDVTKTVSASDLRSGAVVSCGCFHRERLAEPKKDVVDYAGAHDRVRRARGSASTHVCVDCGGLAHHWSYNGLDPTELVQVIGISPLRYSLSHVFYEPRCRSCHGLFDSRSRPLKTHCKHGHAFDDANTFIGRDGKRVCLACRRIKNQRSNAKRPRRTSRRTEVSA